MSTPPSRDPRDHFLTNKELEDLFTRHLQPVIEARRRVARPVFMPIMGQVGAGKTALATVLPARLGVVDPFILRHDDLRRLHPSFTALCAEFGEMEAREVIDTSRSIQPLVDAALDFGFPRGRNIVFPEPLANPDGTASLFSSVRILYRARIHAVAVAVHEAHSLLASQDGRQIKQDWHDFQYSGVLWSLRRIEDDGLADAVTCVARGGRTLYRNTVIDPSPGVVWRDRPGAAAAVETERLRMWTLAEHTDLHRRAIAVTELAATDRLAPQQAAVAATALRRGVAVNESAVALLRERAARATSPQEARSLTRQADLRERSNHRIAAAADRLDAVAGIGPKGRAAAARTSSMGLGRSTPPSPGPRADPAIPPGRSTGRGSSPGR